MCTDNEKLEKQESSKTIRSLFGDRALIADGNAKKSVNKAESACDRDGDSLRDQVSRCIVPSAPKLIYWHYYYVAGALEHSAAAPKARDSIRSGNRSSGRRSK